MLNIKNIRKDQLKFFLPNNWIHLSRLLNFREKLFISGLFLIIFSISFFWLNHLYKELTILIPKKGGEYSEGIVGQPLYINPLLSQSSEADADLTRLIFSGLFKYDKKGDIVPDLAESYEISEDKKTYTVKVRENVFWHDGKKLKIEDIIFTFQILRDPAYKSPLRHNWQGVDVNQKDQNTIEFNLKNPYFGFLNNLTVGILPKHIWENISSEKFQLADINLRPIGSGPYRFFDLQKDSQGNILSYQLEAFPDYFGEKTHISLLNFNFYPNDDEMLSSYNRKQIKGMSSISSNKIENLKNKKSVQIYEFFIPRYFAVFFNQTKSIPLASNDVRKALAYAVNRQEIIDNVFQGKGIPIFSPFFSPMKEYNDEIEKYENDLEKASKILDEAGWKYDDNEKARIKNGNKLEFNLITTDWPEILETAEILKNQWEKIGVKVNINVLTISDIQQNHIRPREFQALLIGQAMSFSPDPYSFWHSSQKDDPGHNFSLFRNAKADELLESARQEINQEARIEKYKEFQKILAQELPAIFLYSKKYLYPVNKEVRGIDVENINFSAGRFAEINKWYIKTKRVLKKNNIF